MKHIKLAVTVAVMAMFAAIILFDCWVQTNMMPPLDISLAQMAHPERPWWDISWLWNHERSRFKVSRVDIRTAVKG